MLLRKHITKQGGLPRRDTLFNRAPLVLPKPHQRLAGRLCVCAARPWIGGAKKTAQAGAMGQSSRECLCLRPIRFVFTPGFTRLDGAGTASELLTFPAGIAPSALPGSVSQHCPLIDEPIVTSFIDESRTNANFIVSSGHYVRWLFPLRRQPEFDQRGSIVRFVSSHFRYATAGTLAVIASWMMNEMRLPE
jgi:hypothetical protein